MWVFGYGSLMSDGWQTEFDCREVVQAELPGYARTFNKKSIERWGTRTAPGPTLNLIVAPESTCIGIAFRFADDRGEAVLSKLAAREGKGFELQSLEISMPSGKCAAIVPIYRGRNVFDTTDPSALAELALHAGGSAGRCRDYVDSAYRQLQLLGIEDSAVSAVWKSLRKLIAQPQWDSSGKSI